MHIIVYTNHAQSVFMYCSDISPVYGGGLYIALYMSFWLLSSPGCYLGDVTPPSQNHLKIYSTLTFQM